MVCSHTDVNDACVHMISCGIWILRKIDISVFQSCVCVMNTPTAELRKTWRGGRRPGIEDLRSVARQQLKSIHQRGES